MSTTLIRFALMLALLGVAGSHARHAWGETSYFPKASGCCSYHGGESGSCSASGYEICNDGTASPTCQCTPPPTPKPTYGLAVNKTGNGSGTVVSRGVECDASGYCTGIKLPPYPGCPTTGAVTGAEINCGSDCEESYICSDSVTLVAKPDTGSVFGGWGGACTNASGTCSVTMTAARNVTATFAAVTPPSTYQLTVSNTGVGSGTVTGTGISCGSDCSETYPGGTSVMLTATPASGSIFTGWSGACTNSSGTCTVAMTAPTGVTATFATVGAQKVVFTPRTGHWWNPAESGTGYSIDIQDGVIVIVVYSYKSNGDREWYLAAGPMTNGQQDFSGPLKIYQNGQCISCTYLGAPTSTSNAGTLTIHFSGPLAATLSLPGGRTTNIQPLNVGFASLPQGLLGEWVFVEMIGSASFADHYKFTTTAAATSTGTGIAADLSRNAACELQVSGVFANHVLCFHWTSSALTTIADQYVFQWGFDQTFDGLWISPTTFNQYPMNGFAWTSRSGYPKGYVVTAGQQSQDDLKREAEFGRAASASLLGGLSAEQAATLRAIGEDFRGVLIGTQ